MTGYPLSWTPEFYLGFIIWGRSPEWLRGVLGACPPPEFFELNVRWDAVWCILSHNFEKSYSVCTDLVASGWFSRCSHLYCNNNNIFFGETGHFRGGGGGVGSFYPTTLYRTLNPKKGKGDCNTLRCPWNPVQIAAAWKCRHNRAVRSTTIGRKQIMETSGPKTLSSVEESIKRRSIVLQPNVPS